ncbi:MAG: T9SS type A sorting domain-containing protein [Bacteroidetes bacterium]|nr:T9SS type A sorting domain-containing protein [Bacteroidota bacterium]
MKKHFFITSFFLLFYFAGFSQANCNTPVHVSICPDTTLLNQTNLGMGDDAPSWCNLSGEDVVYRITVPVSTVNIFVAFSNLSHSVNSVLMKDSCNNLTGMPHTFYTGVPIHTFAVSGATDYFLWIDCSVTVNFNISFGADTSAVFVSHPNTLGNFQFDSSGCASPVFTNIKPFYQVKFNNIYQVNPMTLAPLNISGTLCITTFLKNTSGDAGARTFKFTFGPDYSSVQLPDSIPGFYNAGYWIRIGIGNFLAYNFFDSLSLGRGDFDGLPNSCLAYEFCFDLIPTSNNPTTTNVDVLILSDGYGSAFTGTVYSGCCPSYSQGCHLLNGGSAGGISGLGYGMSDPAGPLPIELISFDAIPTNQTVKLSWVTATETNNDYFTIERSQEGTEWKELQIVQGGGNSTSYLSYENTDHHPLNGTSYYRIKQTDYDGTTTTSDAKTVKMNLGKLFSIYPNPACSQIIVQSMDENNFQTNLFTNLGQKVEIPIATLDQTRLLNTMELETGLYFLTIQINGQLIKTEMVRINH